LTNRLFRLFCNLNPKPSADFTASDLVHSMANDFIKTPNFEDLTFISHTQTLSFIEMHHLIFMSNQRVKWRKIIKYKLGLSSIEEWVGSHIVHTETGLIAFQFESSEWFHQVHYHYYQENILKRGREPMISLVPDCDDHLKFNGPCGKNGEPDIRNLYRRNFHTDFLRNFY